MLFSRAAIWICLLNSRVYPENADDLSPFGIFFSVRPVSSDAGSDSAL